MKNKSYGKFVAIDTIFAFALALFLPFLSTFLYVRGFSESTVALIFTALPISTILFIPYIGKLSDMVSRRVVIWCGIWAEILAVVLYLIPGPASLAFVARFIGALSGMAVLMIILARIEDTIDGHRRGERTGWALSVTYIGDLAGPLLGGFLADYYFIQMPFVVGAMVLFFLSFFLIFDTEPMRPKKFRLHAFQFVWWSEVKRFLRHKELKGMAVLGIAMNAAGAPVLFVFLPFVVVEHFGLTYQAVGIATFFIGAAHIFQGVFGRLADRFGLWRGVMSGSLVCGALFLLVPFMPTYQSMLFILFCISIAAAVWNVSAWALMSKIGEDEHMEGQVITTYAVPAQAGALLSFLLGALLMPHVPVLVMFWILGVAVIVANVCAYPFLWRSEY